MPDLASIPWTPVVAVAAVVLWVLLRESRMLQQGQRRSVKDVLDIAIPVLAVAALAHGFLRSDRAEEPLVNEGELQAEAQESPQPSATEAAADSSSGTDDLLLASAASSSNTQTSDAALLAAALGAFQEATEVPSPLIVATPHSPTPVQGAGAPAPAPAPVVAQKPPASPITQSLPANTNTNVVAVLPADGSKAPGRDGTAVVLSSDGTGVIVTKKGPVVVTSTYEHPSFRALRSCPDESCEIVANLSRFAPLTRTGKRHPTNGLSQRGWVEVRSPGPHCKRYDPNSMTGACLEWQRSSVTGWTRDPTLIPGR